MTKAKVFGCKELSVLKDYKANINDMENVIKILNEGEVVVIDTSRTYWSLDDRQYYEVDLGYGNVGYVRVGGVKII